MSIPATEKQIKYAKDLGIKFPKDITVKEMSQLLDRHLSKDTPSPKWLIQYMTGLGLEGTKYIGRRNAFKWIWNYYKNNNEDLSMTIWFILQVCRHKMSKSWDNPKESGLNSEKIRVIAEKLVRNPKVIASLKRYEGDDLDEFGEYQDVDGYTCTGGSKRTIAYKTANELITKELDLPKKGKIQTTKNSKFLKDKSDSPKSGCLGLIIWGVIISGMAIGFINWII